MEENNTPVVETQEVQETREPSAEVTEVESTQEESTEGMTQEQKEAFLKIQYNKEDVELDKDKAVELAQKGMNYDKILEKAKAYEENPLYKWADEYAKELGFDKPEKFVEAVQKEKAERDYQQRVEKYKAIYGEEAAEEMAKLQKEVEDLKKRNESVDAEQQKSKELTEFMSWYNQKQEQGVFTEKFDVNNVPDEIWDMRKEGMSWKEAYSEYMLSNMKILTEQNVIKSMENKAKTSTGSINEGSAAEEQQMTPEYIEAMVEKHGRQWVRKNFNKIQKSGYFQ